SNLTLAGNLNASSGNSQILTLVSSGTINQTGGTITADELTGSSVGDTTLAQTTNQVGTLEAFQAGSNFSLTDASSLTVDSNDVSSLGIPDSVTAGYGNTTGNLTLTTTGGASMNFAGNITASSGNSQIVTLVSGGGMGQSGGIITADELTGSATVDASFPDANLIGTLEAFRTGGEFNLTSAEGLTVAGADVSSLGFTGVTTGYGNTTGDLTLTTSGSGNGITLTGNLMAESTGGSQTLSLFSAGGIDQTGGIINANILTGSAAGDVTLNDANTIGTLNGFTDSTALAQIQLTDAQALTVAGTLTASDDSVTLKTSSGGITVTGTIDTQNLSFNSAAGIDESEGTLDVQTLSGTSVSDATFTGDNTIAQLSTFSVTTSGNFTLDDNASLAVAGNVQAPGNIFIQTAAGQSITTDPGIMLSSTGDNLVSLQTDALTIDAGLTVMGSTFELAPTTVGDTVTLGSSATNFNNATLNVATARIGAITEPGQTSPTTTAGAIAITSNQDFGGVDVDFETTGAVSGTGAITSVGELSGNATSFDLSNSSNSINSIEDFSTSGDFALADSHNLTIDGTLDATGHTVTLNVSGASNGIDASRGVIEANELTGSTDGVALFTSPSNVINTLGSFSNNAGQFSLTDSVALTVTGTLDATGQALTFTDNGGGVDASAAVVKAQVLQGSTQGDAVFTNASNQIEDVGFFTNTSGDFSLTDNTPLGIGATLDATGHTVTLIDNNGGIDGSAGQVIASMLTGSSTGDALFTGNGNQIGTLASFQAGGNFSLTDAEALTVTGPVTAGFGNTTGDLTLTTTGSGNGITLEGNLTASSGNTQTVTLTSAGDITQNAGTIAADILAGSSGGTTSLTDGTNAINTLGAFTNNSGPFSLTDSVSLTVNGPFSANNQTVTFTDTGALVDFATTLNGGMVLDVVGNAEFDGEVGNTTPLASLQVSGTTDINTDLIHTSGTQLYSGAVTLSSDSTVEGSTVTFDSTLDGAHDFGVEGNAVFDGEVGQNAALHNLGVSGTAYINTDKITASNEQDYGGAVQLESNSTLTVTNGDLNFDSTVDGGYALTLNSTGASGLVSFNDTVGSNAPLASLTINATKAEFVTTPAETVVTVGAQTYNAPVALYVFSGNALDLTGSTITFDSTVTAELPASLNITGNAVFDGAVGGELKNLSVSGTMTLDGGAVTTSGNQTYTGAVTLGDDNTLTSTGGSVDFGSTVDGAQALTVNATSGATTFGAAVGGSTPLTTLDVDTGALSIGGNITTSGNEQITVVGGGDALTVPSGDTLKSTGGNITLATNAGAILLDGNLTTTGQTVTLDSAGAITQANGSIIDTGALTGTAGGATALTSAGNAIGTLAGFTNTNGQFSLTDSTALTITGTLNVTGQTVTLNDTGGGIDAGNGQIIASVLTGSANGDALFSDGANQIGTFANFTDNAGSVSLADSIFLTLTGTIDPTVLTLVDTGGGIDGSGAAIIADVLTGSTTGNAVFTNAGNDIGTLNDFTNTNGAFSLTDSAPLTITGTLNAAGQTVTLVDTGGGINASQGIIDAATLAGSTTGAALFTDASNAIDALNGFETNGSNFSLTDSAALTMAGTLDASGQVVTLVDTGGGIDAGHGVINTGTLTGSTAGSATFTGNNTIGVLDAFQAGGSLSLTDAEALAINGADISGLGLTGVTAGHGGTGNLTVDVTGGLTLASNLAAGSGAITLSSSGNVALDSGAITAGTADITAAGNYTQSDGTIDGSTLASVAATAGNLIINGGSIAGTTIDLTAGQNILIGEQAFTTIALNHAPGSINQINDPLLPVNVGANGSFYEASAAYHNYVFVTAQTLNLTAPLRIVSENTGTLPSSGAGYAPDGIVINQQTTPLPTAISIDGGASGSGTRPQVADLYAILMQGTSVIGAEDIADSAQIVFGPDTSKNNAYQINGCIIHNLNSCTIVSFTIKPMDPNKQADLVIIPGGDQDEDELDLTISGEGNDEIWEDEE
ncbi:MAG TPA: hypothetical protein VMD53_06190, partial [Rhizomicrobium sp.]|nr:hypothetical protein [Rhizomicrobium sp.]